MIEYVKIETPFIRAEDGSKKLIEGKYRNETVAYLKDSLWEFTEKIDGTNISMVLYCYYGNDNWEYHWFSFPRREESLAIVEFYNFLDFMA